MKNNKSYSFRSVRKYLLNHSYVQTYRQKDCDAYHNYKTNEHVLVPYQEGSYTEDEILQLFKISKGTELPCEIELCRFKLFIHQQSNT
ncbi:hypothetical protein KCTC32516_00544 [Polaribacter huanghezhanensis]|uniref:hypothetical protein n=1 Tax=Polaribacter huanghezhanensis TaxID=1354726 RepID=UPI00264990CB|nr:hypothetical protein [Polaribacter huanghezhanensis]WKD85204.1 hypothetical protein KCTC32516_00544 [Polaribacter huanghezhanensis]